MAPEAPDVQPPTRVAHSIHPTIAATPLPQSRRPIVRVPVWLVFLGPTVFVLLAITVFPLVYSLALSLHSWTMGARAGWRWVGVQNFAMVLRADPYFWTSVRVTLTYVGAAVGLELVLGLAIALLLNRRADGRGGTVQTLLILPTMMTPVVVGIVWRLLYNPDLGFLNYVVTRLGLPPQHWLGDLGTALDGLSQRLRCRCPVASKSFDDQIISLLRRRPVDFPEPHHKWDDNVWLIDGHHLAPDESA